MTDAHISFEPYLWCLVYKYQDISWVLSCSLRNYGRANSISDLGEVVDSEALATFFHPVQSLWKELLADVSFWLFCW